MSKRIILYLLLYYKNVFTRWSIGVHIGILIVDWLSCSPVGIFAVSGLLYLSVNRPSSVKHNIIF